MKQSEMPSPVQFWRWISPSAIALITESSVYHWSIEGESPPTKIFDKNPILASGHQVINYQVSGDGKWCLLCGISAGGPGIINGNMQLYSIEKSVSQMLQGHTGVFSVINVPGREEEAQILCFEDKKPDQPAKLYIMEVGRDKSAPGGVFRVQPQNIPIAADAGNDFPVTMNASKKHGLVYMISKMGYLYLFDIFSGKPIYRGRITQDTVFAATEHSSTGGIMCITRKGQVLSVGLNEAGLVPYIVGVLKDSQLAIDISSRLNLPGADDLYVHQFNNMMNSGDIQGAAKVAADSPRGFLRTPETINRFQQMQSQQGTLPPAFQYFSVLLEKGSLNKLETIELAKPIIQQGRTQLFEKWISENKLELSEEFGDLLININVDMALKAYQHANVSEKVINCLMQKGEFDKIVGYSSQVGHRVDYAFMLQQLVHSNPTGALDFAKKLAGSDSGPQLLDPNAALDIFLSCNLLREATAFLLEALKNNRKEEGFLQTRLLEINLLGGTPLVADAILGNEMFTHYDKALIGKLCEQAGLSQRALEHYSDVADIKRVLANPGANGPLNPAFLISFFGTISKEGSLEVLKDMLSRNMRANLNLVVQIATKYSEPLGAEALIKLFEDFKSYEGLFYYLGGIINFSQLPIVHKKYIESAAKLPQPNLAEVERVCRDSNFYDPQEVKQFLFEARLPNPKPLIHVCDKHGFIDELTAYLYNNNLQKYIEVYIQKVSPQKTPQVIGKLLDLEANEEFIKNLLNSVGQLCPVPELIEQVINHINISFYYIYL
jgi:clathrin heavy chain